MDSVVNIIKELESTPSTNEKISIIAKNSDNETFRKVLFYTYADNFQYGFSEEKLRSLVSDWDNINMECSLPTEWDNIFDMLDELAISNINDELRIAVGHFISKSYEEYRELYIRMVTKDLRCNISTKTINKAIPKLIPTWEVQQAYPIEKYKLKKNEWIALSLKLNGCFKYDTPILMGDGSYKMIKDIKVGDMVMSFNEKTKELCTQKVINVFNNGRKPISEWNRIGVFTDLGSERKRVTTTKNHNFFTEQGWLHSSDLKGEVYMYGYELSQPQKDFLLGIGLGDGSVIKDNKETFPIHYNYMKVNNYNYLNYINSCMDLMDVYLGAKNTRTSGYGSEIIEFNIKTIKDIPDYLTKNENILRSSYTFTEEILKNMTPLALAIYFIDDGSISRGKEDGYEKATNVKTRCSFATHRHEYKNVLLFSNYLKELGINNRIKKYNEIKLEGDNGYCVEVTANGTDKLFQLITKYIPYELREIKVPKKYREIPFENWFDKKGSYKLIKRTISEKSEDVIPTSQKHTRKTIVAYDLEVENTHTYFANDFAVHNCRTTFINGLFRSRQNKVMEGYDHILKTIENTPWLKDFVIDGEFIRKNVDNLSDNENFRLTTSIVNSDMEHKEEIQLVVFDLIPKDEFINLGRSTQGFKYRLENYLDKLREKFGDYDVNNNITVAPTYYRGTDHSQIDIILDEVDSKGLEGLMCLRNVPYQCKRHSGILKCKKFKNADIRILGSYEGTGKLKGTLGGFICNYKGYPLKVGGGYTDEQRKLYWNNREEYIGKILQIKYKEESTNKQGGLSAQFPIFVCMRPDKDEESYN